jgi:hypothetical protein
VLKEFACALCLLAVLAPIGSVTMADDVTASNKWRIEVSEGANSDGTIALRVTPQGGTPTAVSVAVKNGRSENGIADDIRDAMKAQLPGDRYQVEVDDGEDVLVKAKGDQPDFALELVSSDVKSTRLSLQRE